MKKMKLGLLMAGLVGVSVLANTADAQCRERIYVHTGSASAVVVASDRQIATVASPTQVRIQTARTTYVKKLVWVEPAYVWEQWGCGRWVKAYKPGHYQEVWVRADRA